MNKKHLYTRGSRIKYNNQMYQLIIRDDKSMGFLKIVVDNNKEKYEYPSAIEFINLSKLLKVKDVKVA